MFLTKLPVWGFPISFLHLSAFYKAIEAADSEVLCKVQIWGRSLELSPHWKVLVEKPGGVLVPGAAWSLLQSV